MQPPEVMNMFSVPFTFSRYPGAGAAQPLAQELYFRAGESRSGQPAALDSAQCGDVREQFRSVPGERSCGPGVEGLLLESAAFVGRLGQWL